MTQSIETYNIALIENNGETERPVSPEEFHGTLDEAIVHAKLLMESVYKSSPRAPWHHDVVGFIIYDDSGRERCRQYRSQG
jgi:hypothetical protein